MGHNRDILVIVQEENSNNQPTQENKPGVERKRGFGEVCPLAKKDQTKKTAKQKKANGQQKLVRFRVLKIQLICGY